MPKGKKAQISIFRETQREVITEPPISGTARAIIPPKLPNFGEGSFTLFPPIIEGGYKIDPVVDGDQRSTGRRRETIKPAYSIRIIPETETPFKVEPPKPITEQFPDTTIKPYGGTPITPKETPQKEKVIPVTIPIFHYGSISDLSIKPIEIPKPIPPEKIEENKNGILPPPITKKTRGRDYEGYNVYIKEGGQYNKVNRKPLPKNKAVNLGAEITDNTLSQQFKVARTKRTRTRDDSGFYLSGKFSYSQGTYKEKKDYAIDSIGEVQGINAKKYMRGYKSVNLF
jgi:hypothetical protein